MRKKASKTLIKNYLVLETKNPIFASQNECIAL